MEKVTSIFIYSQWCLLLLLKKSSFRTLESHNKTNLTLTRTCNCKCITTFCPTAYSRCPFLFLLPLPPRQSEYAAVFEDSSSAGEKEIKWDMKCKRDLNWSQARERTRVCKAFARDARQLLCNMRHRPRREMTSKMCTRTHYPASHGTASWGRRSCFFSGCWRSERKGKHVVH